jgi:hypothetical protein
VRIRSKVLAGATTVALAMGVAAYAVSPAGAALAKHDAANDAVTCNDLIGKIKFSVPLHLGGTTPNSITVSIKSDDCTDTTAGVYDANTNPGGVSLKQASGKGILAAPNNDCLSLSNSLSTGTSGAVNISWSTNTGTPGLTNSKSTFTISQDWAGTYNDGGQGSPATARDSWGAQYGWFAIGNAVSGRSFGAIEQPTSNPSMSAGSAFSGGDSGHNSWFNGTTNQTAAALGNACLGATGIKGITFGIGGLTFH